MEGKQLGLEDDASAVALKQAWDGALRTLSTTVNTPTYEGYIRTLQPLSLHDGTVVLGVMSNFVIDWLVGKKYVSTIETALQDTLGRAVKVRFEVVGATEQRTAAASLVSASVKPENPARPSRPRQESFPSQPLMDRYTFDSFVVGKSNRMAHAAATAVSEQPGAVYNPLFIYGASGLGKTHLLHAVGNLAVRKMNGCRVALIDSESFTQHFVTALRERRTDEFRKRFRSVDIWLVDDIQMIASRDQTKEEFFHTFNALYQTGKQIVISSDRSPSELRTMDERLRSRFQAGLIADISPPELETRVAILERRCRDEGWVVPDDVLYVIADTVQSNVRTLDGALTRVVACASIMHIPFSVKMAQDLLRKNFGQAPASDPRGGVSVDAIVAEVCDRFGVTPETLRGQRRDKETALARQVAMLLCRTLANLPLERIGQHLGNRDHTTVQRGIARVESLMEQDDALRQKVQEMQRLLLQ